MTTERTQDENFDLPDQVRWWLTGGGWIHKDGHFNFNHYCNVVHAKYENIRNNTLLSGNTESETKAKNKLCRSVFPTPR